MQCQQQCVTNNLVDGAGGFIVGAALAAPIGKLLKKDPPIEKQTGTETPKGEAESRA